MFLVFSLVFVALTTVSFVRAVTNPANGTSLSSRSAEWARAHGFGAIVSWAENELYKLHPPKTGGAPAAGSFAQGTTAPVTLANALPAPARLPSPAGAWLPGEGVWHAAGRSVLGVPAVYTTTVRPDATHTSYVVGVAWMDMRLMKASLYSGSQIPGGATFDETAPIPPTSSATLVAAFNAGFRMTDAHGGYYTDRKTIVALRPGAASLVIYKDGSVALGAWGSQVTMTPSVVSVRQNLSLIVNGAKAVPGLIASDNFRWGATLGGGAYVWRSGIGETRNGAFVYVGGPSLSITSLANLLVDAGAVRAMELDINPDWVQYSTFTGPMGNGLRGPNYGGASLLSSMAGAPSRYFTKWWARDFFTVSARSAVQIRPMAASE